MPCASLQQPRNADEAQSLQCKTGNQGSAEQVMKDIRHQTRHHFSAENKNRVVLEGLRGNESTVEL